MGVLVGLVGCVYSLGAVQFLLDSQRRVIERNLGIANN